ncbi:MAG: hypothetical protein GXO55_06640, partial [Chloroflexi bacterium]|nr:hypothetical protein [Chloroflexota bacterium]
MDRNDLEIVVIVLILAPLGATLSVALISGVARYLQGIPRWRKYVLLFKRWGEMWITILASAISFVCTLLLFNIEEPLKFTLLIPIYVDALSVYFVLMVNIIALVASFYIGHYLDFVRQHRHLLGTDMPSGEEESTRLGRFHLFFNFFHLTMVLVPLMDNLVLLWIAVELTTVASAFLVGFRHDRQALEAAWKYTVITSTGVIFALLGTLFLANAIPDITSMEWSTLNEHLSMSHAQTNNPFIILSFLFVLIGYGTKAGFAPMHTWLPDGHGEAPYPVSALLSGVLLKSA